MEITVSKSDVLGRMASMAYYTGEGAKTQLQERAAMAQADMEDDAQVLNDFFMTAAREANTVILTYWRHANVVCDEGVVFTFCPPASWNHNLQDELRLAITDYMAQRVLELWLATIGVQGAYFREDAREDIVSLVIRRVKPI